jgi:multidrug efflux pump subunit AcrA (membrane-fusion protein)
MKHKRRRLLMFGAIAVRVLTAVLVAVHSARGCEALRYLTAPVQYGDINATIQETETVNPVDEVNVGTQVSRTVAALYVD